MSFQPVRIMFVCLGNICRSPLAEGVFRHLVEKYGLSDCFEIESSGTGAWHVGEPPDQRMRATAHKHEIDIDNLSAQQFKASDLMTCDIILAMDKDNLHDILALDTSGEHSHKVRLFREFDPEPGTYQVPDPYYGGPRGFEDVFAIVHRTARVLLHQMIEHYKLEKMN